MDVVLVQGVAPQHGEDCRLEWEPGLEPGTRLAPTHDQDGKTDYHTGKRYVWVSAGQFVGRFRPPSPGVPGKSVWGDEIPARPGNACPITLDENFEVDSEGRVTALIDGALQVVGTRATVSPSLRVRGYVDFETGDIDFPGAVEITDGVRDQFKVRARGDITIGGLIESAWIETDGSLTCRGGMAAKGGGRLLIKGNAELAFLDQAQGEIGGTLTIRREIRNCELTVHGALLCERGTLLGGRVAVRGAVRLGAIGSNAFPPTALTLGLLEPPTEKELEQMEMVKECRTERENLLAKERQIRAKGTATPAVQQALRQIQAAVQDWEQRIREAESIQARLLAERKARQVVDLQVVVGVFPGVSFLIDGVEYGFQKGIKGPLKFGWDENRQPRYRVGDGSWYPLSEIAVARKRAA